MKSITGLLLIAILFVSMVSAMTQKQQGMMKTTNLGHVLRKSHLGRALVSMAQLYSGHSDVDLTKLFDAFTALQGDLLSKKEKENVSFEEDGVTHKSRVITLSEQIEIFKGQAITYQDQLDNLVDIGLGLKMDLRNLEGQLEANQNALTFEFKYLEDIKIKFDQESTDFGDAITLLGQAITSLYQAKTQADNAGFVSFLQQQQNEYQRISILLETQIKKIQISKTYFMKPYQTLFNQLMAQQEPDRATISKAIDALQNLQNFLRDGMIRLQQDYEADKEKHAAFIDQLTADVKNLQDILIPSSKSSIELNVEAQDQKQTELSDAKINLRSYESQLDEEIDSWEQRKEIHDMLVPQYEFEFLIVGQAEQIIRAAQNGESSVNFQDAIKQVAESQDGAVVEQDQSGQYTITQTDVDVVPVLGRGNSGEV